MTLSTLNIETPTTFPAFPYSPPYSIQVDLMRHLYSTIEQRRITIIESPTGTGKTLSLLCASLTWLQDDRSRAKNGKIAALGPDNADWVLAQTKERLCRELEAEEAEYEERLITARKKEESLKRMARARVTKKPKLSHQPVPKDEEEEEDAFLPVDNLDAAQSEQDNISPAVRALMAKVDKGHGPSNEKPVEEPICTKIYYASRTHSQLTQVVPELTRLKLLSPQNSPSQPVSVDAKSSKRRIDEQDEDVQIYTRTVALGSRKQLCINDALRKRRKDLDEGCRELLGEKGDKRCEFLPPIGEEAPVLDFRDQILASPKDIEDLAAAGRISHLCPYFGSRRAIPQAQLVTLPYNLLLQKTAREALGIDLTDQVVIIDEAHNLIPTLLALSTAKLPMSILVKSLEQTKVYLDKFRLRLSATHLLHLKRLVGFLVALKNYMLEWKEERLKKVAANHRRNEETEVMTVAELMERLGRKVAGVNLLQIEAYLRSSKIARKIAGYADKSSTKDVPKGTVPPLHAIETFMLLLTGVNQDGRISLTIKPAAEAGADVMPEIKYQLLNPAPHFLEVLESARSVILAGGTMSPISDVVAQLFSSISPEKIDSFSCGHIIPSKNLQALVVGKSPRGSDLDFRAGQQNDEATIQGLGHILLNLAGVIPAGMIVFFPSYTFLNNVKARWLKSSMIEKLNAKKKLFFEPEDGSAVDKVLQDYAAAIQTPPVPGKKGGALLLAVVSAKLSEGLNFSDDLARSVIIIGLPFPNLGSVELQERLKYVKQLETSGVTKRKPNQKDAGAELYENMTMNAVNQCIGRAIRHRGDWASLILLDQRYGSPSIQKKLPGWIKESVTVTSSFGHAMKELGLFYRTVHS